MLSRAIRLSLVLFFSIFLSACQEESGWEGMHDNWSPRKREAVAVCSALLVVGVWMYRRRGTIQSSPLL